MRAQTSFVRGMCALGVGLTVQRGMAQTVERDAHEAGGADNIVLTVRAFDDSGALIAGAEAILVNDTSPSEHWVSVSGDRLVIRQSDLRSGIRNGAAPLVAATLIVRAPQFAWSQWPLEFPLQERDMVVTLDRGRRVELLLRDETGRPIPEDLAPIIFTAGQSVAAWQTGVAWVSDPIDPREVFSAAVVESLGKGRFTIQVPSEGPSLYVLVNHPGFLRCFQAGPFEKDAIVKGTIEIVLPQPGTISVTVSPKLDGPHEYHDCGFEMAVTPVIPDGRWFFALPAVFHDKDSFTVTYDDLAPGFYPMQVFTGNEETRHQRQRPDYCMIQGSRAVKSGERIEDHILLQTFDEAAARQNLTGDRSAQVTIRTSSGAPAEGKSYRVYFYIPQYARDLTIESGTLPSDGTIAIKNLSRQSQATLHINVADVLSEQIELAADGPAEPFEFRLPPMVGEPAPNVTLTRIDNGEEFELASLHGQVVWLDFWATWCGPCKGPMAKNEEIVRRRGRDWSGKAVVLAASIDQDLQTVRAKLKERGWDQGLQAYCGEGPPGWNCDAAVAYSVRGVPAAFLIDQEGMIRWAGNPAAHDAEKAIDELLGQ